MRGRISQLLILSCAALLAGCGSPAMYRAAISSWRGGSSERLISHWGYPKHIQKLPNGNSVFVYAEKNTIYRPEQWDYGPHGHVIFNPGYRYTTTCTTWFEVQDGAIVRVSMRGADCTATQQQVRQLENPQNPVTFREK